MEIERKWLIDAFPAELVPCEEKVTYSWYISTSPVVRLRESRGRYILTFKGEGHLSREEIESEIPEVFAKEIIRFTGKEPIVKTMKVYDLEGSLKLECSSVDNTFLYAEVEFDSEEEANAFVPPSFLGKEVTYDPQMKMNNYWKRKNGLDWACSLRDESVLD